MGSEQVSGDARELPADGETARGKADLIDASELLCNAYEIALGASETLRMLYERLQSAYDPESTLVASMLFQISCSLDAARAMIAEADEALGEIGRANRKEL